MLMCKLCNSHGLVMNDVGFFKSTSKGLVPIKRSHRKEYSCEVGKDFEKVKVSEKMSNSKVKVIG